jgi:NRAMP (natural resistance-associated macrophage protein)-like metal ion transporter
MTKLRGGLRTLGPGLITGAADDDPSGIATYSTAGAAFGFATLWTALFTIPLMAAVQLTCARIGLVTGRGLAGVLRSHYPRWLVWGSCITLVAANTVNIAADLSGMSEATALVTNIPSIWFHCLYAVFIAVLLTFASYRTMARTFKWLTLVLLAYVAAAVLARPHWLDVLRGTVVPTTVNGRGYVLILVAIFGTTISPYLFFWQASQEVEEADRAARGATDGARRGSLTNRLDAARLDVVSGMSFSNLVAFFIMLTTGATLFVAGQREIQTAREAAMALRPLAGSMASLLFTLGLVGTGFLGVPVLAGSTAYAIAEAGGWRAGMDERPRQAGKFYAVLLAGLLLGMALDHFGVRGFRLLFWAAVLNGLLAPPLIVVILIVANDRRVMGPYVNGRVLNVLGVTTIILMTLAAVVLVVGESRRA